MKRMIYRQSEFCSIYDMQCLCSFDNEVINGETQPIIHQTARILFIRSGKATLRMQGRDHALSEGSIAMIFPWEITEVVALKQTLSYSVVRYNFDILNYFIKAQLPAEADDNRLLETLEQRHVIQCSAQGWERVATLLKQLEDEVGMESVSISVSSRPFTNIFCCNLLVELVVLLYRFCQEDREMTQAEHEKIEMLRYMYLHLEAKITVEKLAQIFYISQSSVRRYVHSLTGLTFNELLNVMRIAKTANYLLYTDLTLEELAELFGFVDASHISKVFQARVGMKVNEYRRTYQSVQKLCQINESRTDYSIVNYILRNCTQNLKVQDVAEQYNITPQELNRKLVYQVGNNFTDFLNRTRINNACKLLLESDYSIADIALRVGYNNIKTFNRNFVNATLMTPSAFRRNVRLEKKNILE